LRRQLITRTLDVTVRNIMFTASVLIVLAAALRGASAGEIKQFYLSSEPLLSEQTEQGVEGLFADVFRRVGKELGRRVTMRRLPWKRAQKLVSESDAIGIGPITRTPSREAKFAWIAPLFPMRIVYMTVRDRSPLIADLDQARRARVVVKRGSTGIFAAKKHKLPEVNVEVVNLQSNALQMLARGRIDAWLTWDVIAHRARKESGSDVRLATGYTDVLGDLYIAASPRTDAAELAKWRAAAKRVIDTGGLKKIMRKYLGRQLAGIK